MLVIMRRRWTRPDLGAQCIMEAAAHSLSSAPGLPAAPRLRSRCFINGLPVSLRSLRALSGLLLDLNGGLGSGAAGPEAGGSTAARG
ncbi:hypothetical protein HaLaN_21609, partial [Haematococcus lacustris]